MPGSRLGWSDSLYLRLVQVRLLCGHCADTLIRCPVSVSTHSDVSVFERYFTPLFVYSSTSLFGWNRCAQFVVHTIHANFKNGDAPVTGTPTVHQPIGSDIQMRRFNTNVSKEPWYKLSWHENALVCHLFPHMPLRPTIKKRRSYISGQSWECNKGECFLKQFW